MYPGYTLAWHHSLKLYIVRFILQYRHYSQCDVAWDGQRMGSAVLFAGVLCVFFGQWCELKFIFRWISLYFTYSVFYFFIFLICHIWGSCIHMLKTVYFMTPFQKSKCEALKYTMHSFWGTCKSSMTGMPVVHAVPILSKINNMFACMSKKVTK